MKEEMFRKIAHAILFVISMIFTVMLFAQFTSDPLMKWIWISFGFSIELLKNYLIKEVKTKYKNNHWLIVSSYVILYLSTAIISGVCTFGTVKLTLEAQEVYTEKMNISSDNIEFAIEQIDIKIERLNRSADASITEKEKLSELDTAYYTGVGKMTADTILAEEEMDALLLERTTLTNSLKEEAMNTSSVSKDVFYLIGEDFGMSGKQTLFWIFIILIFVLEISLYITTSTFEILPIQEETEADMICRYIDALEKDGFVILNSDVNISAETGIPKKDCNRYRDLLKELKYKNKPLVSVNNRLIWNVSTMKKVVREYFNGGEV